jgi:hypothetical protein
MAHAVCSRPFTAEARDLVRVSLLPLKRRMGGTQMVWIRLRIKIMSFVRNLNSRLPFRIDSNITVLSMFNTYIKSMEILEKKHLAFQHTFVHYSYSKAVIGSAVISFYFLFWKIFPGLYSDFLHDIYIS